MTTTISTKQVKARKDHACGYCGGAAIKSGDVYTRDVLVGDGRIYTWVTCSPCQSLHAQVWDWADCPWDEGIGSETYIEWAQEVIRCGDAEWVESAAAFLARVGLSPSD